MKYDEMSHIMNEENRPSDKERVKPPPSSRNPTTTQKSKRSVFIVGDNVIKEIDAYFLTGSLKHQYLVKQDLFQQQKPLACIIT